LSVVAYDTGATMNIDSLSEACMLTDANYRIKARESFLSLLKSKPDVLIPNVKSLPSAVAILDRLVRSGYKYHLGKNLEYFKYH
jgi:hypothetical protein